MNTNIDIIDAKDTDEGFSIPACVYCYENIGKITPCMLARTFGIPLCCIIGWFLFLAIGIPVIYFSVVYWLQPAQAEFDARYFEVTCFIPRCVETRFCSASVPERSITTYNCVRVDSEYGICNRTIEYQKRRLYGGGNNNSPSCSTSITLTIEYDSIVSEVDSYKDSCEDYAVPYEPNVASNMYTWCLYDKEESTLSITNVENEPNGIILAIVFIILFLFICVCFTICITTLIVNEEKRKQKEN